MSRESEERNSFSTVSSLVLMLCKIRSRIRKVIRLIIISSLKEPKKTLRKDKVSSKSFGSVAVNQVLLTRESPNEPKICRRMRK